MKTEKTKQRIRCWNNNRTIKGNAAVLQKHGLDFNSFETLYKFARRHKLIYKREINLFRKSKSAADSIKKRRLIKDSINQKSNFSNDFEKNEILKDHLKMENIRRATRERLGL